MARSQELFDPIPGNGLRLTIDSDLQGPTTAGTRISNGKIKRFIDLIGNEQYSIRVAATRKLAAIGKRAVPALLKAIQGGVWYTRECAAQALGGIGDPRAIEPLISSLKDENVGVRRAAAGALARMVENDCLSQVADALGRIPADDRRSTREAIRKVSPLAGRKLDEVLGDHGSFHKKLNERVKDDTIAVPTTGGMGTISSGAKRLLNKLWRSLQTGS